jgi:hypothetical protein
VYLPCPAWLQAAELAAQLEAGKAERERLQRRSEELEAEVGAPCCLLLASCCRRSQCRKSASLFWVCCGPACPLPTLPCLIPPPLLLPSLLPPLQLATAQKEQLETRSGKDPKLASKLDKVQKDAAAAKELVSAERERSGALEKARAAAVEEAQAMRQQLAAQAEAAAKLAQAKEASEAAAAQLHAQLAAAKKEAAAARKQAEEVEAYKQQLSLVRLLPHCRLLLLVAAAADGMLSFLHRAWQPLLNLQHILIASAPVPFPSLFLGHE